MQRYIVFLNDREVIIDQEVNSPDAGLSEMNINFTGKSALVIAFKHFCLDLDCLKLRIKVEENISEACDAFNSMFTRIEAAGGIVRNQQNK